MSLKVVKWVAAQVGTLGNESIWFRSKHVGIGMGWVKVG